MRLEKDFFLIFIMVLWGTMHPIIRSIEDISSDALALIRFSSALLVILIYGFATGQIRLPEKKDIFMILVIGMIGGYLPSLTLNLGIERTSATIGSILINTNPLFVAIILVMISGKIDLKKIGLIVIGIIGAAMVATGKDGITLFAGHEYLSGIIFLLLGAAAIGINTVFNKETVKKYGGVSATAYTVGAGSIMLLIHSLVSGSIYTIGNIPSVSLLKAVYIGIIPTGFCWTAFFSSLKHMNQDHAASFKLLIPVVATILSVIFLKESLDIISGTGIVVVLSSLYHLQKTI